MPQCAEGQDGGKDAVTIGQHGVSMRKHQRNTGMLMQQ